VGASVFRAFLARNGARLPRPRRQGLADLLAAAAEARARILRGTFPASVLRRLAALLDELGPAPFVVRSSSLLEDGFEDAFTGKYESVFCARGGPPAERLEALVAAIRTVYASALGEEALRYRDHRGLLDREESMALLVQRVSGTVRGSLCFPLVAGVALSHNPWPWSPEIDASAGVARIVLGLGTRAVERSGDDHPRLVALNAPLLRPEEALGGGPERTQREMDVVDLAAGRLATLPVAEVRRRAPGVPLELVGPPGLDRLLAATPFVEELRELLRTLAAEYGAPVAVEFALDAGPEGRLALVVLQCRPLQAREHGAAATPPAGLDAGAVVLESRGPVIGLPVHAALDRVVFVDPATYEDAPDALRHEVARAIGRITRLEPAGARRILLLGPGRWGSSAVSLGVPVSLADIQRVAAVGEIVSTRARRIPDVSLGSHFFGDLVEADILYFAIHPERPGNRLAEEALRAEPNRLAALLPADAGLAGVLRVVDFPRPGDGRALWLNASAVDQRVLCFLAPAGPPRAAPPGGAQRPKFTT
jgi:hypothetical protein